MGKFENKQQIMYIKNNNNNYNYIQEKNKNKMKYSKIKRQTRFNTQKIIIKLEN